MVISCLHEEDMESIDEVAGLLSAMLDSKHIARWFVAFVLHGINYDGQYLSQLHTEPGFLWGALKLVELVKFIIIFLLLILRR